LKRKKKRKDSKESLRKKLKNQNIKKIKSYYLNKIKRRKRKVLIQVVIKVQIVVKVLQIDYKKDKVKEIIN
jgi:hypothetical protein